MIYPCCNFIRKRHARDNQKLSKLLSRGFERSVYWSEYKAKSETKISTNGCRYFLEPNYVRVNRLFVLFYSNEHTASIRFKTQRYYLPKGLVKTYNVIISGKNFHYVKWWRLKKVTTGQGEDYTTGCLLSYEYIENHSR